MNFISTLNSFSDAFKTMGFEMKSNENEVFFKVNGVFEVYNLRMSYDGKCDIINFNVCFFDLKKCKFEFDSKDKNSDDLMGRLSLLTSYANLFTSIGYFLNIEDQVYFCLPLPFSQFLNVNEKLVQKVINTIVDVCDRFLSGFTIGVLDDKTTLSKFSHLVAPCMCVG